MWNTDEVREYVRKADEHLESIRDAIGFLMSANHDTADSEAVYSAEAIADKLKKADDEIHVLVDHMDLLNSDGREYPEFEDVADE